VKLVDKVLKVKMVCQVVLEHQALWVYPDVTVLLDLKA